MELKTVRGTRDILPGETEKWQWVENRAREVFSLYGYEEIRTPVFENTELFVHGIGQGTDIVNKEMYTFLDRKGRSISLRPEGTASVVRAYLEHGLGRGEEGEAKLSYIGPMFRYERPQAGRYRQFYQIGAEHFGNPYPDADAECIAMLVQFFKAVGLEKIVVDINSVGDETCRPAYHKALVAHLEKHKDSLSADSQNRILINPMRVLDSKDPKDSGAIESAPKILEFLDPDSKEHFEQVKSRLLEFGVDARVNTRLVRGLDYYSRTVFEILAEGLGAQNAVCGGGRYDGLVGSFSKTPRPAVGFAVGQDRLMSLLDEMKIDIPLRPNAEVAMVLLTVQAQRKAREFSRGLREKGIRVWHDVGTPKSAKNQFKRASQLGALVAVVIGDDELGAGVAQVKNMATQDQKTINQDEVVDKVAAIVHETGRPK